MSDASRLKVLIIGGGNIAGAFDEGRSRDAWPLSHAGAYVRDGRFILSACVEPDAVRNAAFRAHWPVESMLSDIDDIPADASYDIISICSPTHLHAAHLERALQFKPRLVFCEKPLTPDLQASTLLVERFEQAGIAMAVNHTRRWAPDVVALAAELRAGQWGRLRSITGLYNKGILNNGSHLIDLLGMLAGELQLAWAGEPIHDHWPDDPTIPAVLLGSDGTTIHLAAGNASDFALFELQLVTERGVIAMEGGGMSWRVRSAQDSERFAGYRSLDAASVRAGDYERAMAAAVDNLWRHLQSGDPLSCTGREASQAQQLCERIRQQAECRAGSEPNQ